MIFLENTLSLLHMIGYFVILYLRKYVVKNCSIFRENILYRVSHNIGPTLFFCHFLEFWGTYRGTFDLYSTALAICYMIATRILKIVSEIIEVKNGNCNTKIVFLTLCNRKMSNLNDGFQLWPQLYQLSWENDKNKVGPILWDTLQDE